jgi:hypothetical protein
MGVDSDGGLLLRRSAPRLGCTERWCTHLWAPGPSMALLSVVLLPRTSVLRQVES